MSPQEADAIEDYIKRVSRDLDIPEDIFVDLIGFLRYNVIHNQFKLGWKVFPSFFERPSPYAGNDTVIIEFRGLFSDGNQYSTSRVLSRKEYNYSQRSGANLKFLKEQMKAELLAEVANKYLNFPI